MFIQYSYLCKIITNAGWSQTNPVSRVWFLETVKVHLKINTAVKPAAVQKNTVKPAAIEIKVRVY